MLLETRYAYCSTSCAHTFYTSWASLALPTSFPIALDTMILRIYHLQSNLTLPFCFFAPRRQQLEFREELLSLPARMRAKATAARATEPPSYTALPPAAEAVHPPAVSAVPQRRRPASAASTSQLVRWPSAGGGKKPALPEITTVTPPSLTSCKLSLYTFSTCSRAATLTRACNTAAAQF